MAYCILRAKKLKSFGAVAGSVQHTLREIHTPNADESRTPKNQHIGPRTSSGVLGVLRELLPQKRRKDAVIAIEYLVTASKEFFVGHTRTAYFKKALEFLKVKHGKQNVISAVLHLDETSPHMVVYVVPLNSDGRLSAKDFLGGREKLSQLQSSFFEKVGASFGLERGVKGSVATHQAVQRFYTQVSVKPELKPLGRMDKLADVLGVKTQAAREREHAEASLEAQIKTFNRERLQAAQSSQKNTQKSLESLQAIQKSIQKDASVLSAELELERIKNFTLREELTSTHEKLANANETSRTLYDRTQSFEALMRSAPAPNTLNKLKEKYVSSPSKSRLAP